MVTGEVDHGRTELADECHRRTPNDGHLAAGRELKAGPLCSMTEISGRPSVPFLKIWTARNYGRSLDLLAVRPERVSDPSTKAWARSDRRRLRARAWSRRRVNA